MTGFGDAPRESPNPVTKRLPLPRGTEVFRPARQCPNPYSCRYVSVKLVPPESAPVRAS
ncbi:hypothetical protein GCM10009839_18870 [Catenulispora yoronensis]|uniref:Uncharacterized protein n=1 Tax=Catenulispora yoronensis TaxID=450799 RepID=A0ABN2TVB0_9ACTN